MTRGYSIFVELGCTLAVFIGAFGNILFIAKMRREIGRNQQVTPEQSIEMNNYIKLLRIHRSIFPASSKRKLFWTSEAVMLIGALALFIQSTLLWHFNRLPK
jgi:hypothetical protein